MDPTFSVYVLVFQQWQFLIFSGSIYSAGSVTGSALPTMVFENAELRKSIFFYSRVLIGTNPCDLPSAPSTLIKPSG